MAQEWKTFSSENREAATGGGSSAERPRVSMHPFGEVTRLEMQRAPPEPSGGLVYSVMEITPCHPLEPDWVLILLSLQTPDWWNGVGGAITWSVDLLID